MPTSTHQVTPEGLVQLELELAQLKTKDRPETVKRLAAARELGDLSENADYSDAREQLAFIEGRIEELEVLIKHADVVRSKGSSAGAIAIGSTVTLSLVGGKTVTYQLVGSNETDPLAGKISIESPVGSMLLGHKAGESVSVRTPSGEQRYTIKSVV